MSCFTEVWLLPGRVLSLHIEEIKNLTHVQQEQLPSRSGISNQVAFAASAFHVRAFVCVGVF